MSDKIGINNMNRYIKFIVVMFGLLSFYCQPKEEPRFNDMALAIKYLEATSKIDVFTGVVKRLNKSCGFNLAISESHLAELDYELRKNSLFNFDDFTSLFKAKKEYEATVEIVKKQRLKEANGCNEKSFIQWIANVVVPNVKQSIGFIKKQGILPTAFVEPYSNEFMLRQLKQKADNYKVLPINEVKDIASALSSGSYIYAIRSYTDIAPRNTKLALAMRKYIVEMDADLDNVYYLAQTQAQIDLNKGINIYKKAAKLGHHKSQLWLGQHYLCINNKKAAAPWLEMATKHSPGEVEDIVGEYEELGKPVYCGYR